MFLQVAPLGVTDLEFQYGRFNSFRVQILCARRRLVIMQRHYGPKLYVPGHSIGQAVSQVGIVLINRDERRTDL